MSIHGAGINQEGEMEDVIRLHDLPDDILFHIFMNMNLFELNEVRQTSRFFNHFCRSSELLNALSHQELTQIIHLTHNALGLDGEELEDIMNIVWADSFFETYRLTWQEYAREIGCLLSNPSFDEAAKSDIRQSLNGFAHVSPENFILLNHLILIYNRSFASSGVVNHYADTNNEGFNFSNLGLTRLPLRYLMRIMNITRPLVSLDLSHNHIKYLPKSLEQCLDLWSVDLSDNDIDIIPEYFPKFTDLDHFNIKENRISDVSPTVRQWLKRHYGQSCQELLNYQKNKKEAQREIKLNLFKYMVPVVLYLLFVQGYIIAHPEEEFNSSDLNQLPFHEHVDILFKLSRLWFIVKYLLPEIHNSLNLAYRQNLTDSFTISSEISIPSDSADAQSYELGRQSQRSWLTYFKSFSHTQAYSREYYAGLSDERHNLPSRIQGQEEDFQSKARRLLFRFD